MKVIELLSCLTFLTAFTSAVEIQCEFGNGWEPWYTCRAVLTNTENPATVTDISGTHLAGKGNENVKAFYIQETHKMITSIPKGIENFFGDLEAFSWRDGNIATIDSSTFEPFENLLSIWLMGNKLVTLSSDLFQHTRKLREIYVYGNLLQHVGHDLLTGLTNLTVAFFGNNPCINVNVNANTLLQIEELKIQLAIQCPPLATTPDPPTTTISTTNEPNECPISCTGRIEEVESQMKHTLNEEADNMKKRMDVMLKEFEILQKALKESHATICLPSCLVVSFACFKLILPNLYLA